ncbi:terpenoid cyclases/Protein prenyltransferase [Microthyrium microscopicum]|uniref:Terpenoid cyclases/Protein prenyltransferase n=1 Tax=Microthyrium microscopicum TaxID=703497 RepID=A0A6A6U3S2_9PEZI|nr:terpenoid cyclases/Protein prenyltransferase [Microthyrium microscopicum]
MALNCAKQKTYWLRCLKTFLPNGYTSMDSNRMMIACFIISALDILSALDASMTTDERSSYIEWIYASQQDTGGFQGFPRTPDANPEPNDSHSDARLTIIWEPATVPSTFFALAALLLLRDDFSRVGRRECLTWLTKCQRADCSFGQNLNDKGEVDGGYDTRFGYLAMHIRWMLGGDLLATQEPAWPDVNIDGLVRSIRALQAYDGGFGDLPCSEPHGGYTNCAVNALAIVDKLADGIPDEDALIHWLVLRQTRQFEPDNEDDEDEDEEQGGFATATTSSAIGFNGRCNKIADTCYTWWICDTLKTLGQIELIDKSKATSYLLNKTQHFIGGFGKYPSDPPDIYHSYLGLAALGILGCPDVKPVHSTTSISVDAVDYLEKVIRPGYS